MTAPLTEILRAALGGGAPRALLLEPSGQLAAEVAAATQLTVQVRKALKGARRLAAPARGHGAAIATVCAAVDSLPFERETFDAVACCSGAPEAPDLEALRSVVREGGVVLVASRVREGVAGGAASLVRRAARSGALPRAAELTALLLRAGMRPVRQASAKRAVVPTVVTWGEVQPRKWEKRAR